MQYFVKENFQLIEKTIIFTLVTIYCVVTIALLAGLHKKVLELPNSWNNFENSFEAVERLTRENEELRNKLYLALDFLNRPHDEYASYIKLLEEQIDRKNIYIYELEELVDWPNKPEMGPYND